MDTVLEMAIELNIVDILILAMGYIAILIRAIVEYRKDEYMLYIVVPVLTVYPLFMVVFGANVVASFGIALLVFYMIELVEIDTED